MGFLMSCTDLQDYLYHPVPGTFNLTCYTIWFRWFRKKKKKDKNNYIWGLFPFYFVKSPLVSHEVWWILIIKKFKVQKMHEQLSSAKDVPFYPSFASRSLKTFPPMGFSRFCFFLQISRFLRVWSSLPLQSPAAVGFFQELALSPVPLRNPPLLQVFRLCLTKSNLTLIFCTVS